MLIALETPEERGMLTKLNPPIKNAVIVIVPASKLKSLCRNIVKQVKTMKGNIKSGAKGINFEFANSIGRSILNIVIDRIVRTVPIKIEKDCFLTTPLLFMVVRVKFIMVAINKVRVKVVKMKIAGFALAIVFPGPLEVLIDSRTNGDKLSNPTTTAEGMIIAVNTLESFFLLLGNIELKAKKDTECKTEINKCVLKSQSVMVVEKNLYSKVLEMLQKIVIIEKSKKNLCVELFLSLKYIRKPKTPIAVRIMPKKNKSTLYNKLNICLLYTLCM